MTTYTINFTQTEELAMKFTALSVDEWIQNAAHERARIAIDEIVSVVVQKCLETNTQIPGTKDEIVALGFEQQWIKTMLQRNQELQEMQNLG